MENIQMNFIRDWQTEIIQEMRGEGLQFLNDSARDYLIVRYFNYLRKQGLRKPRKVHKSKEFSCPPEYEMGLNILIDKLAKGDSISPFMSKQVEKLINDGMFNDWGVLHLHLGEKMDVNNKYIERTGPLLFLYLKDDDAYLIDIFQHGDWTDRDVLQIVENNWPELLDPFRIKGAIRLATDYTNQQHQQLRNAGITMMLELTDKDGQKFVIFPPGGGVVTSGDSLADVRNYQNQINELRRLEDFVLDQIEFIKDTMRKQNVVIPNSFEFKLINQHGKWEIKEEGTGMIFDLF